MILAVQWYRFLSEMGWAERVSEGSFWRCFISLAMRRRVILFLAGLERTQLQRLKSSETFSCMRRTGSIK